MYFWFHLWLARQFLERNKLGTSDSTVSSSVSTRQGPDSRVNHPSTLSRACVWSCSKHTQNGLKKKKRTKEKKKNYITKCSTDRIIKGITTSAQHKVQIKVLHPDQGCPRGSKNAFVRCWYLTNIWFCSVQAHVCICALQNWTCFLGRRDLTFVCQRTGT